MCKKVEMLRQILKVIPMVDTMLTVYELLKEKLTFVS